MIRLSPTTAGISLVLCLWSALAGAEVRFHGVAAGDMTATDVILWTRAEDDGDAAGVTAQVATDPSFASLVASASGATVPTNNNTLKLAIGGLTTGQTYYYRFVDAAAPATTSAVGRFTTAPTASQSRPVRFGFSGDADGMWRPFPSIATIAERRLDFFIFLGDTIYETKSDGSPATPRLTQADSAAAWQGALAAYNRKYNENIQRVGPDGTPGGDGQAGMTPLFLATGLYVLLDNHELGNRSLQAGGAPAALVESAALPTQSQFDINPTGPFNNQTTGFLTLLKAFYNNLPSRVDIVGTPAGGDLAVTGPTVAAPDDPRSHGTPRHFFAQQWGPHAVYIQTDNRSYRDARLWQKPLADDTGPRADNPDRTMLGRTQLAWLKQTLRAAQAAGTTWKFVAISSPIDQSGDRQDGKSWYGGYRAERNDLLRFIAEEGIRHVVFLATDDHYSRAARLRYAAPDGTLRDLPDSFLLVTGPIGAGGPDQVTDHGFPAIRQMAAEWDRSITAVGGPPIGLAGMAGLRDVFREGSPDAATNPSAVDFFSADTFAYTVLEVAPDGILTVQTWGLDSYARNTFRKQLPVRALMGFTLAP
ncbi:MAG: alkaline phosphatase D family protein [Proteobacteria bacterium]|nr:alkaline phosphatase D family protein [Pseudomonadota bacterium]